jgi:hypothetical protein
LPKSLEGAVGAFVQLDKRISAKRTIISDQTAEASQTRSDGATGPALGADAGLTIAVDDAPLTDAEIEALAKTLARARAGLSSNEDTTIEMPTLLPPRPPKLSKPSKDTQVIDGEHTQGDSDE